MIEFEQKPLRSKSVDLTPMVDMVFLLLIFFLLTSVFSIPRLPVDLPISETAQSQNANVVNLFLVKKDVIRLNDEIVSIEKLPDLLVKELQNNPQREVSLAADRNIPLEQVVRIMDAARRAGARQLSIQAVKN